VSILCEQFAFAREKLADRFNRLMCGLFALDTSFVIFYNTLPRVSAEELMFDMPCSSESYFSNSIEACRNAAIAELESHPPQLSVVIAHYLGNQLKDSEHQGTRCRSILHFFVLITGTYEPRYENYSR
jgi:hypothetical protein